MEYQFAQGDQYLNEVIEERRLKRAQNSFPQTPFPSMAQGNPNYTTPNNLPETEKENNFQQQKSNYQLGTLSSKYESLKKLLRLDMIMEGDTVMVFSKLKQNMVQ